MIRIDGYYLYSLGFSIHPLTGISIDSAFSEWRLPLYIAQHSLQTFLGGSIYQLKVSQQPGQKLLAAIKALTADPDRQEPIQFIEAYNVTSALTEFEHVLTAEFGMMNLYFVLKKRGYDTTDLIENGVSLFPPDLPNKVPEAADDINQATRCIAFELATAAGFHLHRANEAVLHRWYDAVSGGAPRPAGRNIGDYLAELRSKNYGSEKIRSALKDLKDLHRNPLIHPQDSLESIDEAIALTGSIHAVVVAMLRDIPPVDLARPAAVE